MPGSGGIKGREPVANTSSSHGSRFRDAQPPLLNIDFIDRLARPQAHPVPGVPLRRQQRDLRRRFSPASSGES